MMAVKNLHKQYAGVMEKTHKSYTHHESSKAITDRKGSQIQAMMTFIEEKGSPFSENAFKVQDIS